MPLACRDLSPGDNEEGQECLGVLVWRISP
jgi:hypothetical protein